jgi:hypothetical protein
MRWGLLQGLKQGIRGWLGEHMDFVNDIYLISSDVGGKVDPLPELSNVINSAVTSSINFNYV